MQDGNEEKQLLTSKTKTPETKTFQSKECQKPFTKFFKTYMRSPREKEFLCKKCGALFARKDVLETHIKTHYKPAILIDIPSVSYTHLTLPTKA